MPRILALILFFISAIGLHAQTPEWLMGTWEHKGQNEDGRYFVRYVFSQDSVLEIGNLGLTSEQTMTCTSIVQSFEQSILRLRVDTYKINGVSIGLSSLQGYAWEMSVFLVRPNRLRVIDEYKNDYTGETVKDMMYFKRLK
jgi:hypothetical protein